MTDFPKTARPHDAKLLPGDLSDEALIANTHPANWRNPTPAPHYDLVVIGGGTAGLVSAGIAGMLGAKTALIERDLMGGDCLVTGCVPSKAIIRTARAIADIRRGKQFGLTVPQEIEVDFTAAMARMRRIRARISQHDAVREFSRKYGVDVFLGDARFTAPESVNVNDTALRFSRAVIATGSRAAHPEIPGLVEAGFFTNETIFNLTTLPRRLAVLGGGPIGCELAQAFARFGSEVTLIDRGERLLSREDADTSGLLQNVFHREKIQLQLNCTVANVRRIDTGIVLQLQSRGSEFPVEVDTILVGAGRLPNLEGLDLNLAGVERNKKGILVDDFLRTTHRRIFAAGDCCLAHKFTHTADASARVAVQNALVFPMKRWSKQIIPWVTYTDPEIAHVGINELEAANRGLKVDIYRVALSDVDRAITDGEEEGFLKVLTRRGSDRIVGAMLVASHAGEMIGEITSAMVGGLGLRHLSKVIHPYPTQAEVIRKVADQYAQNKLTSRLKWLLRQWRAWRR